MPFDPSSAVSAGVATIGNLIGGSQSYKYQKKLAEQQFGYNKELLKMQQDFNNPKAQMNMYREAGVNPYAALGNATSISGQSVSQGNAPDLSNIGSQAVNAYAQSYPLQSEKDQRIAQAENALAQKELFLASKEKIASETKNQRIQNDILESTAEDHKTIVRGEAKLKWAQYAKTDHEAAQAQIEADLAFMRKQVFVPQVKAQLADIASQIRLRMFQGQLAKAQAREALSKSVLSLAQANHVDIDARTLERLNKGLIDKYYSEQKANIEKARKLGLENDWFGLTLLFEGMSALGSVIPKK